MTRPTFLDPSAPPVLIFGGKGGVGKTTCAAAAAIATAHAHPDERVVLVSTDPAHSVSDALAGVELPDNLRAVELDAAAEHAAFMSEHTDALREIASRGTFLDDTDIERFLDLSLPGVDELMNFLRLASWFEDEEGDRFVIDTAPTGHALRLLSMPETVGGWMEAIEALLGKHRYMASVFGGGAEDAVETFVESLGEAFENIAGVWSEPSLTRFVPVMNAEALSIAETARLLESLETLGIDAPEIVLNRVAPADVRGSLAVLRAAQMTALADLPASIQERQLAVIPLRGSEPRGALLETFFDAIKEDVGSGASAAPAMDVVVEGTLVPGGKITLVAGKGGVGKTSVSCATALRRAELGERTLLVSTDPAGSLSDALQIEIGADAVEVAPGLQAVQLDADRELKALKGEYADEIEGFFDNLAMDLSFDREALEHLLELAPTGIDEVMAMVRMTEILDEGSYEAVVIDTAPTGHTLRLLELPELVQAWLEQIFAVLVKYENLMHLPRLNARLLKLSKGLKTLRAMLGDGGTTSLLAVTIPTRLGAAETARLVDACGTLDIRVAGVVVNQLTTDGGDELSSAIVERERRELASLEEACGEIPTARVFRGGDLRGVERLGAVGAGLYPCVSDRRKAA
ncbi:MAG: ArsA family ATPase [Planctomycetota bacterium]